MSYLLAAWNGRTSPARGPGERRGHSMSYGPAGARNFAEPLGRTKSEKERGTGIHIVVVCVVWWRVELYDEWP